MNFKTIIIFFAGVGIGAFGARWYLKDKYEKELDASVDRLNDEYEKERKQLYSDAEIKFNGENIKAVEEAKKELKHFRTETKKLAYDSYFSTSIDEGKEAEEMAPVESVDTPYLISANDFATDRTLDKVTLTYYIYADLLCEEGEAVENDYDELLGDEWRHHFNDEEYGVVYVRNEKMGADYEVILDEMDRESVKEYLGYST